MIHNALRITAHAMDLRDLQGHAATIRLGADILELLTCMAQEGEYEAIGAALTDTAQMESLLDAWRVTKIVSET